MSVKQATPKRPIIKSNGSDPLHYIEMGHAYAEKQQYAAAVQCFRKAIALDPRSSTAYNNLGQVLQLQDEKKQALQCYKRALKLNNKFKLASKNLASLYFEMGRYKEAKEILVSLFAKHPADHSLLETLIGYAMASGKLREASKYAEKFAALRFAYGNGNIKDNGFGSSTEPRKLSVQKLQHDIAQFRYLQKQGIKIKGLESIIQNYDKVLKSMLPLGTDARQDLTAAQDKLIGREYNRIIHRPHTPRVKRALSTNWDVATAAEDGVSPENDFMKSVVGLTVIDNFLTPKALAALRKFCLESTIWFENRYAHGRLGAFFRQGFNCPLLIQIGEEIKARFPNIIGEEHSLLQIWGFKCDHFQPVTAPHADFAAVNVNFWITPEEMNLDENSGGMVIYDVEAPLDWDFDSYNNQGDKIIKYLKKKKARGVNIPYKANRAIIFNSDLFHATAPVQFRNNYESRRINVTMLYGRRENAPLLHDD